MQAKAHSSQLRQQATIYTNYLPLVEKGFLQTIIPDTTKVLGDDSSQDLSSISTDGTVYNFSGSTPDLQNLQVGDIMIGDTSSTAPDGFLRQVTGISSTGGGGLSVTTTDATIEQAVQQISLTVDHTLTADEIQNAKSSGGLHPKAVFGPNGVELGVDMNNVELYTDPTQTNQQVIANGSITLSPTIHFSLTIQNYQIQNIVFSITGVESANLSISSSAEFSGGAKFEFPPIILGAIPTPVGPILPELTFYVGVDGSLHAGVSAGITDTVSWTAGVNYIQGQWGNIDTYNNAFTYTPPVFSIDMDAKGLVGAEFSLMLDGVAGPHLAAEAYLRLTVNSATSPTWTLYGGFSGNAGVEIKILSKAIVSYDADLFDVEWIIAPAATVDVKVNGSDGPVNLTTADTFSVSWTSTSANSCTGSGAMAGETGTSGSYSDGPKAAQNFLYSMTCSNLLSSATDSVQVNIVSSGNAKSVGAGYWHSCALLQSGGVKCWGDNYYDQLGNGGTGESYIPVNVVSLGSGVSAVSVGYRYACALLQTGAVECWGGNADGELGDGTTTSETSPVSVTGLSSGVLAISAGSDHTCALMQTGGVKCWGSNGFGQLGDGTTTQKLIPEDVVGLGGAASAISAGDEHTCALMQNGGIKCWGDNGNGQLGDGTSNTVRNMPVNVSGLESGVSAVSAGGSYTCALLQTGGVKCWGYNGYGQVGDGTTSERDLAANVSGLTSGVSAISAGNSHTCALMQTGGVKCWGDNDYGELGNGTTSEQFAPVDVLGLGNAAVSISAGGGHTCAVLQTGGIACWGQNSFGELGNGITNNADTPVNVVGIP